MEPARPNIFEYLDLYAYLYDYYKFRKANESGFSYESWITELDLGVHRSFLRMVVLNKKKAPDKFLSAFSEKVLFSFRERDYFQNLVKVSHAGTNKEKQSYTRKLIQILKIESNQKVIADYSEVISSPSTLRLLTLLGFKDLKCTTNNLINLLQIEQSEVEHALAQLQEMQIIQADEVDGVIIWKTTHDKFRIDDQKGSLNLMRFHEQSLLDAIQAFHKPKEVRKYETLLLPMSPSDLQDFYKYLDDFVAQQILRFSSESYGDKRVFQMNFNIYPVSKNLSDSLEASS